MAGASQEGTWKNMTQTAKITLKNRYKFYVNLVIESCMETR